MKQMGLSEKKKEKAPLRNEDKIVKLKACVI